MSTSRRSTSPESNTASSQAPADSLRVIKKYPNRRLYDTRTSSYITLTEVKQMVLDAEVFEVRDAKSGEDLTRSILLQIILEEESAGTPIFSTTMLAQMIRFYGHTMQGFMGAYLEKNLQSFIDFNNGLMTGGQPNAASHSPQEAWTQFMTMQAPVMQGLMSSYFDQSGQMLAKMQAFTAPGSKR
jgi:polyhydroxyalkanoate synthesis repressor PhaR